MDKNFTQVEWSRSIQIWTKLLMIKNINIRLYGKIQITPSTGKIVVGIYGALFACTNTAVLWLHVELKNKKQRLGYHWWLCLSDNSLFVLVSRETKVTRHSWQQTEQPAGQCGFCIAVRVEYKRNIREQHVLNHSLQDSSQCTMSSPRTLVNLLK